MRLQVVERIDTERLGILEKIRKSSQRYELARAELQKARFDRDELVVVARDLYHVSYAELAAAIGQARGSVHRILTDREAFRPAASEGSSTVKAMNPTVAAAPPAGDRQASSSTAAGPAVR